MIAALFMFAVYALIAGVVGAVALHRARDRYRSSVDEFEAFFVAAFWPITLVVWLGMRLTEETIVYLNREPKTKLPKARIHK